MGGDLGATTLFPDQPLTPQGLDPRLCFVWPWDRKSMGLGRSQRYDRRKNDLVCTMKNMAMFEGEGGKPCTGRKALSSIQCVHI